MKSKKLLTLLIVVAVFIVAVIVLSSVFSVRKVVTVYHGFDGGQIASVDGAPTPNDVLRLSQGKSIIFLSKDAVINKLNLQNTEWHTIGIVKNFPNILEVHFVKRVAVVKMDIGDEVYLDCFGYVVDAPADGSVPLDISSAIESPNTAKVNVKGQKFEFESAANNNRLSCILESIMALWQCKCEIADIPGILGKSNVFSFDIDGVMTITTRVGAKILVMSPEQNLTTRLIDAFSVYCDSSRNLQTSGREITVWPDGKITTPQ